MTKAAATQRVLDFFARPTKKQKHRRKNPIGKGRRLLIRKLNEVIYGKHAMLKVHSKLLGKDFWIINEGLINIKENNFDDEVLTMAKLADLCYRVTKI
jgi:hypothetical protein